MTGWRTAVGRPLAGVVAALVAVGVARLAGTALSVWAAVAAGAAVGVAWEVQRWLATVPAPLPRPARTAMEDNPYAAYTAVKRRVDFALTADEGFGRSLQPFLQRLAADRLRQRDGIDGDQEDPAVRAALGDRNWELLYGPAERPVAVGDLEELVRKLGERDA